MSRTPRLTCEEAAEIRQLYATGEFSQHSLAKRFDVGQMTISRLITGDDRGIQTPRAEVDLNNVARVANAESIPDLIDHGLMLAVPDNPGFWATEDGLVWTRWKDSKCDWADRPILNEYREVVPTYTRYPRVTLYRCQPTLHTVILLTFRGPCPSGMEAIHLDDNPLNSALSNLIWGTHIENCAMRGRS